MKNIKRYIILVKVFHHGYHVEEFAVSQDYIHNFDFGIEDPNLQLKFSLVLAKEDRLEYFCLFSEVEAAECMKLLEGWKINEPGHKSVEAKVVEVNFNFQ